VIMPVANQKDVADIPKEFKDKMNFIFVENLDEVFALAFDKKAMKKKQLPQGKPNKKTKLPAASAA